MHVNCQGRTQKLWQNTETIEQQAVHKNDSTLKGEGFFFINVLERNALLCVPELLDCREVAWEFVGVAAPWAPEPNRKGRVFM
jgi:hypothetical protein